MRFIDFFAGIGGIRLGLEQAGHTCIGWCEFDKYARKSYCAEFDEQDIEQESGFSKEGRWISHDIRTASSMELPKADLWCFGFP